MALIAVHCGRPSFLVHHFIGSLVVHIASWDVSISFSTLGCEYISLFTSSEPA